MNDLLIRLWPRLSASDRKLLEKIVVFHHPGFDPYRATSFPNIETLLSEMSANEQLFSASRAAPGGFTLPKLHQARQALLLAMSRWFHEIYAEASKELPSWVRDFASRVITEDAIIISFNWDLVLDRQIFGNNLTASSYGLGSVLPRKAVILKPHGSLNWYEQDLAENIKAEKRALLHSSEKGKVYRFIPFRAPKGKQLYTPLIVPPVFNKEFGRPILQLLWQRSVSALSRAKNVTFLGYSLPEADLHARFILRCGFFNQREGELSPSGSRLKATGEASVTIVNPDLSSARRIESVAGSASQCDWYPTTVERWFRGLD